MKFLKFILVLLLFASGCATQHPTPTTKEISKKREELEALGEELNQTTLQLVHLQRDLSTNGTYSAWAQARDLDWSIATARQARDKLVAKYRHVVEEFHGDLIGSY